MHWYRTLGLKFVKNLTENVKCSVIQPPRSHSWSHGVQMNYAICLEPQKRKIYHLTDPSFEEQKKYVSRKIEHVDDYRDRVLSEFQKNGAGKMSQIVVENLLYVANNAGHLESILDIMLYTFEQKQNDKTYDCRFVLSIYLNQCIVLKAPSSMVKKLMNNPFNQKFISQKGLKRYYEILYENKDFQDIVDDITRRSDKNTDDLWTFDLKRGSLQSWVVLFHVAALARIGTNESLEKISKMEYQFQQDTYNNMRVKAIYSWLAYKKGNLDLAYDMISYRRNPKGFHRFYFNLELAFLLETENIEEMILRLERLSSSVERVLCNKNPRLGHIMLCIDIMLKLMNLTKAKAPHRIKDVAIISERFASYGIMTCETLESLIFEPLEYSLKDK